MVNLANRATVTLAATLLLASVTGCTQGTASPSSGTAYQFDNIVDTESANLTDEQKAALADADAWHVTYDQDASATAAHDDGGVTEWRNRYFIAHDWSDAGSHILSLTDGSRVEVNARIYVYEDSRVVERGTNFSDIEGWALPDKDCIAMQTCVDDGYRIVRLRAES